ncbi:MAG: SCO family protein, partial [Planctomyces sp.]
MNTPVSVVPGISFRRAGLLLFAASLLLTVEGFFPGNPFRQEPKNQNTPQPSNNPAPRVTLLSGTPLEAAMEDRRSDAFPDTMLTDHHGRTHRFRSDLVRDRVICIMFFYTECQGTCPTSIRNMAELREALYGEFSAQDLTFISITLDPENDTPAKLKEYADTLELRTDDALAEWLFCTGETNELDTL